MGRCVLHHIFKHLLVHSQKIPIKPVPFCFLLINRCVHSIACKLSIVEITFVLTAVIEKQVPPAMSFKFFNIAIVNLTHWVLHSHLTHNLPLDPVSFNNLAFGQSQFSLPMKFVQKQFSLVNKVVQEMQLSFYDDSVFANTLEFSPVLELLFCVTREKSRVGFHVLIRFITDRRHIF
jgi:hypothetical protein